MKYNAETGPTDGERTSGYEFMKHRIRKILLVCCSYDGYILEEDGHIEQQINQEYIDLNMSNPPALLRVSSTAEALDLLREDDRFDFILTMYNVGEPDVFDFAKIVKERHRHIPVVLLTSFSKDIYRRIDERDASGIDYIFSWSGNTDLVIGIIKLIEDAMNAEEDILTGGVQAILLVEDSVRFYSTYLPALYKLILQQNTEFLKDAFNEQQQILRKRARPKILLATNYADAVALYERYKKNLLGVISDVGFVLHKGDSPSTEKLDAGIDLCRLVRADNPLMPVLLQSSQTAFAAQARELGAGFIAKNSKTLLQELSDFIAARFAFGDFLFKDLSTGRVIGRAKDLHEMQRLVASVPDDVFEYNTSQNNLSKWLYSRGLFPLAASIRQLNKSHFRTTEEHRAALVTLIRDYRTLLGQGVVAKFDPATYSDAIAFARIGEGSLGGKARGLAFMNSMLVKYSQYAKYENVRVTIPRTVVVATDYFDAFIRNNGLEYVLTTEMTDEEILSEFVSSTLPYKLREALKAYVRTVSGPLAVRSSSKLEDSHYQPFAGIYSTYMIPYTEGERRPPAASVAEGDQERLRIDLFRGVEGLRAVFAEPDRRGEDGRRDPGGVRHGAGRALLPHALGRGSVDQLLPHRRRDARKRGSATSPSDWASWSSTAAARCVSRPATRRRCCKPPRPNWRCAIRRTRCWRSTCAPKRSARRPTMRSTSGG